MTCDDSAFDIVNFHLPFLLNALLNLQVVLASAGGPH